MSSNIRLKKSVLGFWAAGLFIFFGFMAYVMHLYSVKHNTGDSGESAIMVVPFCLPWILVLPQGIGELILLSIPFNAFILYMICGGISVQRRKD